MHPEQDIVPEFFFAFLPPLNQVVRFFICPHIHPDFLIIEHVVSAMITMTIFGKTAYMAQIDWKINS
jgi:hypothetical protein